MSDFKKNTLQRSPLPLTSRHQVVSHHGHAEVSCQGGQGGLDAREFLREACSLGPKIAESTKAENPVGMVAKDVVPVGQQVVGFNELEEKSTKRSSVRLLPSLMDRDHLTREMSWPIGLEGTEAVGLSILTLIIIYTMFSHHL